MGIRGHIETTQPEYKGHRVISSWGSDEARDFLVRNGIDVWDNDGNGDTWEIDITDELKDLVADLVSEKVDFEDKLSGELKGSHYGKDFGLLLLEGLDTATLKNYSTIRIDWF